MSLVSPERVCNTCGYRFTQMESRDEEGVVTVQFMAILKERRIDGVIQVGVVESCPGCRKKLSMSTTGKLLP